MVIGTVKTLAPKYGVDLLIRAFAGMAEEHPEARLSIVGGGPQEAELRRLAKDLGIGERVDFRGAVAHAQVPEELRRLDVYAAFSRADSESFGVAVIEASACGLPVVVSRVGGLPEVVEEERTGIIVPRDDAQAAGRALKRLADSTALRHAMGHAGRVRVEQLYGWPYCVDRMLKVLSEARSATVHGN